MCVETQIRRDEDREIDVWWIGRSWVFIYTTIEWKKQINKKKHTKV